MTYRVLISAAASFLSTACATSPAPVDAVTGEHLALNPFDRIGDRPGIMLTGEATGRLSSNGRCLVLGSGTEARTLLWPEGTRVERRGADTVIVLPDGRGTAVMGKYVRLAGGAFPASQIGALSEAVRQSCPNSYFSVSRGSDGAK
jgi:hypothetical protein